MRRLAAPAAIVSVFVLSARSSPSGSISTAPTSHLPPVGWGRAVARWSTDVAHGIVYALIAALPASGLRVCVGPPLSPSGPRRRVEHEDVAARRVAARRVLQDVRPGEVRAAIAVTPARRVVPGDDRAADVERAADAVEPAAVRVVRVVPGDRAREDGDGGAARDAAPAVGGVAVDRAVPDVVVPELKTPPPLPLAVLPLSVLWSIVAVPSTSMPAPWLAALPVTVLLVSVSVEFLLTMIPPPLFLSPLRTTTPSIVTPLAPTANTRSLAPPSIVVAAAPG